MKQDMEEQILQAYKTYYHSDLFQGSFSHLKKIKNSSNYTINFQIHGKPFQII